MRERVLLELYDPLHSKTGRLYLLEGAIIAFYAVYFINQNTIIASV